MVVLISWSNCSIVRYLFLPVGSEDSGWRSGVKYAKECGFDQITGIDIPGEKTGNVPDEDWYDKAYGKYNWNKAVMLNLGIGQGEFLVTPLSLAQFYCGLVNHGMVMKPHLLRYLRSPNGETNYYHAEIARGLPFSEETLEILKEGCYRVVNGGGTAGRSRIRRSDSWVVRPVPRRTLTVKIILVCRLCAGARPTDRGLCHSRKCRSWLDCCRSDCAAGVVQLLREEGNHQAATTTCQCRRS